MQLWAPEQQQLPHWLQQQQWQEVMELWAPLSVRGAQPHPLHWQQAEGGATVQDAALVKHPGEGGATVRDAALMERADTNSEGGVFLAMMDVRR